jgi:hypothetical protein
VPVVPEVPNEIENSIAESVANSSVSNSVAIPESFAVPEIAQTDTNNNASRPDPVEKWSEGVYESPEQPRTDSTEQNWSRSPWESVAGQSSPAFSLDELNLLELPNDATPSAQTEEQKARESDVTERVNQMTPEIVDQIARATASQISEELVREIAQRIVPKVIEQVIARQNEENKER